MRKKSAWLESYPWIINVLDAVTLKADKKKKEKKKKKIYID